jgi:hypothetical protein
MAQEYKRSEKRVKLILSQLRELADHLAHQAQGRQTLRQQHAQERLYFSLKGYEPMRWASLITRQSEQRTHLGETSRSEQEALLARQQQELLVFDQD